MSHPFFAVPRPTVIGHRGCAGEVPENTLASFEAGLAAGAHVLESDVHLTRDGVPVLIHDDDVSRVTDGSGPVREHSRADLARLDAGHHFSPDGGRSHPWRGRGLRIPTLAEALAAFPGSRFNLELKEDVPEIVERSVDVIARADRGPLTLLTAALPALMARIHAHLDATGVDAARGASEADVLAFLRAALDGVAPPPGPMALQVPAEFAGAPLVTAPFVRHAHAHGLAVHVWTINEPDDMRRLLALGVDGLVSDFPRRVARVVAGSR